MSRNTEMHFSQLPKKTYKRSRFDLSHRHLATAITGKLYPCYMEPIYPGDSFDTKTSKLIRLNPSVHVPMDNAYDDTYFFFVPYRIIWDDFEKFLGANDDPWAQTNTYRMPSYTPAQNSAGPDYTFDCLAHYFGVGVNRPAARPVNILPFRAYYKIYNDFFRDENLDTIVSFSTQSGNFTQANNPFMFNGKSLRPDRGFQATPILASTDSDGILYVNKLHDVYTSCLPSPQKGPDVLLPLENAPIIAGTSLHSLGGTLGFGSSVAGAPTSSAFLATASAGGQPLPRTDVVLDNTGSATNNNYFVDQTNLEADMSTIAPSINAFRLAMMTQGLLEAKARGGTRYVEILKFQWGITSSDGRLQRAEYLGGKRTPITMAEVVQTSSTDSTSALGHEAGHSKTFDVDDGFVHSFTEHGLLIGVHVIRTEHSYSQGTAKFFDKFDEFDLYNPRLALIGEQPVYTREIYDSSSIAADRVFGYQEAWYELRLHANEITGLLTANAGNGLNTWHYGDLYTSIPSLSADWMKETYTNVDRTLAVQASASQYQWLVDFWFDIKAYREAPVYSAPAEIGRW